MGDFVTPPPISEQSLLFGFKEGSVDEDLHNTGLIKDFQLFTSGESFDSSPESLSVYTNPESAASSGTKVL